MCRKYLSCLLATVAALAVGLAGAGQASAAMLEQGAVGLLAIYGTPGSNGNTLPVGGGLGRNFGFGPNFMFRASTTNKPGKNFKIKIGSLTAEARDSFIGGTWMSNKTGGNNPLSFTVQFVDLQDSVVEGVGAVPAFADTSDRPWIAEICSPEAALCRVDPRIAANERGDVKIENVSINLSPGFVVQGTMWGKWKNGAPPCITLNLPPAEQVTADTLYVTQTKETFPAVGSKLEEISGEACLISANNYWYSVGTEKAETEIKISNKG
jgi:hypothetical protein